MHRFNWTSDAGKPSFGFVTGRTEKEAKYRLKKRHKLSQSEMSTVKCGLGELSKTTGRNPESSKVQIGDWNIQLVTDDDGHLSVYIDNKDSTKVHIIEEDIADNNEQWADRFTTEKIEQNS